MNVKGLDWALTQYHCLQMCTKILLESVYILKRPETENLTKPDSTNSPAFFCMHSPSRSTVPFLGVSYAVYQRNTPCGTPIVLFPLLNAGIKAYAHQVVNDSFFFQMNE